RRLESLHVQFVVAAALELEGMDVDRVRSFLRQSERKMAVAAGIVHFGKQQFLFGSRSIMEAEDGVEIPGCHMGDYCFIFFTVEDPLVDLVGSQMLGELAGASQGGHVFLCVCGERKE